MRSRFVDCIQYSRWRRRCGRCATRNTPESFSLFFLQALCSPMLPWFAKTDHWRELVRADNRLAISGSSTLPVSTGGFARSQSGISPIILCGATCRKRVLALGRGACEIPWTTHFPIILCSLLPPPLYPYQFPHFQHPAYCQARVQVRIMASTRGYPKLAPNSDSRIIWLTHLFHPRLTSVLPFSAMCFIPSLVVVLLLMSLSFTPPQPLRACTCMPD